MVDDLKEPKDPWDALLVFTGISIAAMLPALVAVFAEDPFELHVSLNNHHTALGDLFFPYATWLASGWVTALIAIALLWRMGWRAFGMVAISALSSSAVVQVLKNVFFQAHDRPSVFLDRMPGIQLVHGEELLKHLSFPSGHSAAAFSTCLALAVLIGRRMPALVLVLVAGVLAYSRVYLSQHFTGDVLAGAFIGIFGGIVAYGVLYRGRFARDARLDRSPFRP